MKLQIFNAENSTKVRTGKPMVGMNVTTGLFRINGMAVELMGLKENDQISVAYDEEGDEWYIFKDRENGFTCRRGEKSEDKRALNFGCASLARKIFDYAKYEKLSGYCLVGSEAVRHGKIDYYPLITGTLKND